MMDAPNAHFERDELFLISIQSTEREQTFRTFAVVARETRGVVVCG
jgi:hypothetical protein